MKPGLQLGFAVLAVLSALVTAEAAVARDSGQSAALPLTGETLAASEVPGPGTSVVSGTCNLLGTSVFTFRVTGVASPPYPGTFVEEGTFTLGPAVSPVVAFESNFTIFSSAGTVTGTKTLDTTVPIPIGACGAAVFAGTEANAISLQAPLRYEATITTPTGTATDSGTSFVSYDDTQIRAEEDFNGFNFTETFMSTSFDPGGGDDDDDGGGDDDDDDRGGDG